MAKSVYRSNGTITDYITPYGWETLGTGTTGDAIQYADDTAADTAISQLDFPPSGYSYGKSNPPPGPHRPT